MIPARFGARVEEKGHLLQQELCTSRAPIPRCSSWSMRFPGLGEERVGECLASLNLPRDLPSPLLPDLVGQFFNPAVRGTLAIESVPLLDGSQFRFQLFSVLHDRLAPLRVHAEGQRQELEMVRPSKHQSLRLGFAARISARLTECWHSLDPVPSRARL